MLNKIEELDIPQRGSKINYWKATEELFGKLNELITAFNNLPNEIIESLRCPECGGQGRIPKDTHYRPCLACNGTGIRLPEKTDQVSEQVGKSCGNCIAEEYCGADKVAVCRDWEPAVEKKDCDNCGNILPITLDCNYKNCFASNNYKNWKPIEQSEIKCKTAIDGDCDNYDDFTCGLMYSRYDRLKTIYDALKAQLAEKDKEISDLKIQAKSLSAQFERAEMFRKENETKDKEIERLNDHKINAEKEINDLDEQLSKLSAKYGHIIAERDKYKELLNRLLGCHSSRYVVSAIKEALGEG